MHQAPVKPQTDSPAKSIPTHPAQTPDVLARRKSCSADGVGLSHYILMERKKP